jgi:hypothetical protein
MYEENGKGNRDVMRVLKILGIFRLFQVSTIRSENLLFLL